MTNMSQTENTVAPNVRSSKYFIVESRILCLQCNAVTAVFALSVPAGYESLIVDDDTPEEEEGTWDASPLAAVLSYVDLPESVASRVRAITSHYRPDLDEETGETFWMNHCEHCGAQMMEEELHGDPDSPFSSMPSEGLHAIKLHEVREPFTASVGSESHDLKPLDS